MRVAIDVSPLSTGHKVRGVGFYLKHLKDALEKYFPEHEYIWFEKQSEIPKKVDIVHFPYFDPFILSLPLRRRYKTVVTVHDLTPLVLPDLFPAGFKGLLKWRVQRLALKTVDAIITDSRCSRQDVIKLVGMPAKKVFAVYLAAGEQFGQLKNAQDEKEKLLKKYNLPEKFALYVGDVTPNKNVPRIIQACIEEKIPLVLVGKALAENAFDASNPWNRDLVEARALIETAKNVFVLGFVSDEDVVGLYNSATMSLMPSLYEGFGLPAIEAMQCGCPLVASRGGSLAEVVEDGGYIVDPMSIESMKEGFAKVFSDSSLQKDLQAKGLLQAKKFSWKKAAEDTIKTYEKVLEQK